MKEVDDCSANREVEFPDGEVLEAISFKAETEEFLVDWFKTVPPDKFTITFDEWYNNHILTGAYKRCHDCNVLDGGYHHPGCDMERCPRCGGQLISCGCLDEPDEEEIEEWWNDWDDGDV